VKDSIVGEERLVRHLLMALAQQAQFPGMALRLWVAYSCLHKHDALRLREDHSELVLCVQYCKWLARGSSASSMDNSLLQ